MNISKKTKRLTLRTLTAKDYEVWREAYTIMRVPQNEWDEANWDEKYLTRYEFKKILESQKNYRDFDKAFIFGVFRNDDGALIGHLGFNDISRAGFQNAYLGYRIFNPYWGYGYAKEAVKAALDIGFKKIKLHRIEAGIQSKNIASIRVAESAKLKKEGLSTKRLFYKGKWVDLLVYATTCEKFKIKYKFPVEKRKRSKPAKLSA